MISNVNFSQVPACVSVAITAANECYPCVCEAVEWISGKNLCGNSATNQTRSDLYVSKGKQTVML